MQRKPYKGNVLTILFFPQDSVGGENLIVPSSTLSDHPEVVRMIVQHSF